MKQSPKEHSLDSRLRPSKFSGNGFLGNDTRQVQEIISDDKRAADRAGIDINCLVECLNDAYVKARDAMGATVKLGDRLSGTFKESMGKIPSPFPGEGVFPKGEAEVTENSTGATLRLTALGIHLIKTHGFFQGKGSPYRIDPETAWRFFKP